MKVVALDAWAVDAPLLEPFGIAGGAQEIARNVVVRARLDGGAVGHGEGAPFPAFNGETQEGTLAAIEGLRARIVGRSDDDVADLCEGAPGSARCAIETAVLDARARLEGRPIFAHRDGALVTDVTIPIRAQGACARSAAAWVARGFTRLKVKIGGAGLDDAYARVVAVHEGAPGAELLLDGNAGLSARDAIALIRALAERGIVPILFEQPCGQNDVDGLVEVGRATRVAVAADESASSVRDVERLIARGERVVVNVKPMKYGFRDARRIIALAKAHGLRLMMGGMVEGRMAMSASACLAASEGGFDFIDLDTPLFLATDPFVGGYAQRGPRMDLSPIRRGHGCEPIAEGAASGFGPQTSGAEAESPISAPPKPGA